MLPLVSLLLSLLLLRRGRSSWKSSYRCVRRAYGLYVRTGLAADSKYHAYTQALAPFRVRLAALEALVRELTDECKTVKEAVHTMRQKVSTA